MYRCIWVSFSYVSDLFYFSLLPSSTIALFLTTHSSTRSMCAPGDYSVISDTAVSPPTTPHGLLLAVPPESSSFSLSPVQLTFARRILVSYYLSLAYKYSLVWPR